MKFTLDTKTWNHLPLPMSKYDQSSQKLSFEMNHKALIPSPSQGNDEVVRHFFGIIHFPQMMRIDLT
jgi:hypothetical protein